MAEAGLQEVDTYVSHHQNTFSQYIATSPIMDLCLVVEQLQFTSEYKYQEVMDLEGCAQRLGGWNGRRSGGHPGWR